MKSGIQNFPMLRSQRYFDNGNEVVVQYRHIIIRNWGLNFVHTAYVHVWLHACALGFFLVLSSIAELVLRKMSRELLIKTLPTNV